LPARQALTLEAQQEAVTRLGAGFLLVAGLAALAGCTAPSSSEIRISALTALDLAQGERPKVAASTTIVADVLARVGGDDIDLTTTLPPGADPHEFEPTPREIEALSQADVLFISGLGYEMILQRTLSQAGLAPATVALSEGLESDVDPAEDPHVWLDPRNVMLWVDNAARALGALDPAHAEVYSARAAAYRAELEALDLRLESLVEDVPQGERKIVADHQALGHLAARYGLEIVGSLIPGPSDAAEPSARSLAELQATMQVEGIHVILLTSLENQSLAERVAADTGARLVRLYVESLGDAGGPADSYIGLMEYNLAAISDALNSP